MDNNDIRVCRFISQFIEKDDVIVDVGANVGDYTSFFSVKLHGTGKVFSIELSPDTFKALESRFIGKSNITLLNYAVSDSDGQITYYKGQDSCTNNIIGHDMNFAKCQEAGVITSVSLDTLLKDVGPIKMIKIDVEGAELSVLRGMGSIIKNVQYIVVECHLDEDWDAIRDMLLVDYELAAVNIITGEKVDAQSKRPYQCFCKQRFTNDQI